MRWLLVALLSGGCVVEQQSPIADDAGGRDAESEGEQRFQPPDRDEDEEDAELPREDRDAAFAEGGPEADASLSRWEVEEYCSRSCQRLTECAHATPSCGGLASGARTDHRFLGACVEACREDPRLIQEIFDAGGDRCEALLLGARSKVPELERICAAPAPVRESCETLCEPLVECALDSDECALPPLDASSVERIAGQCELTCRQRRTDIERLHDIEDCEEASRELRRINPALRRLVCEDLPCAAACDRLEACDAQLEAPCGADRGRCHRACAGDEAFAASLNGLASCEEVRDLALETTEICVPDFPCEAFCWDTTACVIEDPACAAAAEDPELVENACAEQCAESAEFRRALSTAEGCRDWVDAMRPALGDLCE